MLEWYGDAAKLCIIKAYKWYYLLAKMEVMYHHRSAGNAITAGHRLPIFSARPSTEFSENFLLTPGARPKLPVFGRWRGGTLTGFVWWYVIWNTSRMMRLVTKRNCRCRSKFTKISAPNAPNDVRPDLKMGFGRGPPSYTPFGRTSIEYADTITIHY